MLLVRQPTNKYMVNRKSMVRPEVNPLVRKKLQNIRNRMMSTCYNKNNPKYHNYGGRGVTVCDSWHKLAGLLMDYDTIKGWDEDEFLAGRLQLDKDIKLDGNKLYSKETCLWVSPEENMKVKPSYQKPVIAVHISGYTERVVNYTEFGKRQGIPNLSDTLASVAKGNKKFYLDWYFYYENSVPN